MQQEREVMRKRLDEELKDLNYDKHELILQRTHPRTWLQRIRVLWNREIELPLVPIGMVAILILGWSVYQQVDSPMQGELDPSTRQIIEVGGSTYWEDSYERVVMRYENKNED